MALLSLAPVTHLVIGHPSKAKVGSRKRPIRLFLSSRCRPRSKCLLVIQLGIPEPIAILYDLIERRLIIIGNGIA